MRRQLCSTLFPYTTLFRSRSESKYDAFGTGHSSTAISAALGMAIASKLKGEIHKNHIAVVGDASIVRSEEHTSELQSRPQLVCRLLLEKKNNKFTCVPSLS